MGKQVLRSVLFLAVTLVKIFAQCPFSDPLTVRFFIGQHDSSIETVGGITYLTFSYQTRCPQELWKQPATVQGTNVDQRIAIVENPSVICPGIFPLPVTTNQASFVIGKINAGDYLLRALMRDHPLYETIIFELPFTVPTPSQTISLLPADSGKISFRVNGTSNVTYRVETSSTLTNWTTIHTSVGGPFNVTNQLAANAFYRVQISDGIPLCP